MIEAGPSRQTASGANKGVGGASARPQPKKKNIFQKIGSSLSPKNVGNAFKPGKLPGLDTMPRLPGGMPGVPSFGSNPIQGIQKGLDTLPNLPGMPSMGGMNGLPFQKPGLGGGIMGPSGPVNLPSSDSFGSPPAGMMQTLQGGPLAQHYMNRGQANQPVYMNNQGGNQGAFRQLGIPLSPPTSENSRGFGGQMGVGGNMNQYAGQGKPIWMT